MINFPQTKPPHIINFPHEKLRQIGEANLIDSKLKLLKRVLNTLLFFLLIISILFGIQNVITIQDIFPNQDMLSSINISKVK
jgi:hypothetical protein